jgi:hypothetical protein
MKTEEFKALTASVKELCRDHSDVARSLKGATREMGTTRNLWKSENKPLLIKAGLALLLFPEPVVSDAVGTLLLAAGAVQMGIRRQAVYVDDLPKAFQSAMRELKAAQDLI